MVEQIRPALVMLLIMTLITGVAYPLAVTAAAQVVFPGQANGSLLTRAGRLIGSELIGQGSASPRYFHPRPSAAGNGYDALASGGSNLGPTSRSLIERIRVAAASLQVENPGRPVPVDLVTSSGSGLDPHISPAGAEFQVPRVARARGLTEDQVRWLVREHTEPPQWGLLGEARVNVLALNLALDQARSSR